ncbi:MAG: bifunctional nuclease family protein, partial [Leptospiraceae bacterium]|nr:bifunctional nuclease family protein [Leptospiraceae bacterium]
SIFYARIVVQTNDGIIELDARPSDSVAIAIRTKCPMYMHEKVYREAAVIIGEESQTAEPAPAEEEPQSELEKLKQDLQKAVDAENFERAAILRDKINKMTQDN